MGTPLQYALQQAHKGNLQPAREAIETLKVNTKKQKDEMYALCSGIQEICCTQAISGAEELVVEGYEKILKWKPLDKNTATNLSVILMKWGNLARARSILESLFDKFPDDLCISTNLGTVYFKTHQLEKSLDVFHHCAQLAPNDASSFNGLGTILMKMGQDKMAIDYFKKTVSLEPMHPTAYMNLATLLFQHKLNKEAYHVAEIAAKVTPSNPEVYFTIANMMFKEERLDEAAEMFQIALQVDPNHNKSRQALARILSIKGRIEESKELLSSANQHRQHDPSFYFAKLELEKKALTQADEDSVLSLINSNTLSNHNLCVAYHALSRSSGFKKDYKSEIRFLREGNSFKRLDQHYRPGAIQSFVDQIINTFSDNFISSQQFHVDCEYSPIFIIGAPRSGSTLTEQIISSHAAVGAIGESGFFGNATRSYNYTERLSGDREANITPQLCQSLTKKYLDQLHQKYPDINPTFTDKSLFNLYHVGLLRFCFPKARFINCIRHPVDNSIGMFKQMFIDDALNFTDDFDGIVEFYKAYQKIINHWDCIFPGMIYHSHYEQLVENFEEEARKLIAHCNLGWDEGCLRFYENTREIKTSSATQVRQPLYKSAVARWKLYEPYVQDLIGKLNEAEIKF